MKVGYRSEAVTWRPGCVGLAIPAHGLAVDVPPERMIAIRHLNMGEQATAIASELVQRADSITAGGVAIRVADDDTPATSLDLLIVLGSVAVATDADSERMVQVAQHAVVPVLPVFDPAEQGGYRAQLPPSLYPINGHPLRQRASLVPIVDAALQILGLAEADRRLFISHARDDGDALADQLRRYLLDRRWDVFVDRFDIPPAVNFQERLDIELCDKSYLLLLETAAARARNWVGHEVAYALDREMGFTAVNVPAETGIRKRFESVPPNERLEVPEHGVRRRELKPILTEKQLGLVGERVEHDHAAALRRRREELLLSVRAYLERQAYRVIPLSDWVVLGQRGDRVEVVRITPRAPRPHDLRDAHETLRRVQVPGRRRTAWVVHPLEDVDRERRGLTRWLVGKRRLHVLPIMDFARELG